METRTAVITGGSRGLGRALVIAFGRAGYRVWTTARDARALSRLEADTRKAGVSVVAVAGDVARAEDNARLAHRLATEVGTVDMLVHNAGILGPRVPLAAYPLDAFDEVLAVNLRGPFDLTRRLVPLLGRGATIQFVTSGVGNEARERWGAYNVSKWALEGMARIWALELRDAGIRVQLVDPGPMRTAMRAAAHPEEDPARLPSPDEIAPVFVRLSRDPDLSRTGERFEARGWIERAVPPGQG